LVIIISAAVIGAGGKILKGISSGVAADGGSYRRKSTDIK